MATAARTAQQGTTITLYIEVRDIYGVLVDSTTQPLVSIYPFDSDPRDITTEDSDALVLESTSATHVAQGIYSFDYDIPSDAHVGTWFDKWTVTIDDAESTAILLFDVIAADSVSDEASVNVGTITLMENNVIIVTIDSTVAALDGQTLGSDYQYYFSTTYNPLYSSVRKVRLRAGIYMSSVPDDTINLAVFEASREADAVTFGLKYPSGRYPPESYEIGGGQITPTYFTYGGRRANTEYLSLAQEKYATCMAIWFILSNSLGPSAKRKRLADFSVDYGEGSVKQFMDDLRQECLEWESVLNSGGYLSKGSSLPGLVAAKGVYNQDTPKYGRRILDISRETSEMKRIPAANTKVQPLSRTDRWKHTFRRRS